MGKRGVARQCGVQDAVKMQWKNGVQDESTGNVNVSHEMIEHGSKRKRFRSAPWSAGGEWCSPRPCCCERMRCWGTVINLSEHSLSALAHELSAQSSIRPCKVRRYCLG
jgi:hypothetical protein